MLHSTWQESRCVEAIDHGRWSPSQQSEMLEAPVEPTGGLRPPSPPAELPPFVFRQKRGKLEWRKISGVDLDRVEREVRRRTPAA